MSFLMTNYYFDTSDYSSPVKVDISSGYEYSLIPDYNRVVNIKIRRNTVTDVSSYLPFASSTEYSFFSIGDSTRDIATDTDTDKVFEATFELDNKYQTIDRKVFTLSDLFGNIGGMDSILWIIAFIFVRIFSSKIYVTSLISNFYDTVTNNKYSPAENNHKMPVEEFKQPNQIKKQKKKLFDEESSDISKDDSKIWSVFDGIPIDNFKENIVKQDSGKWAFKDKILSIISSRRRYVFKWGNVLLMVFWYPWFSLLWRQKSKISQNFKTFKSGEQKIKKELDIKNILNSIRNANSLVNVVLNKRQKFLLQYQQQSVIYPEDEQNSSILFENAGLILQ